MPPIFRTVPLELLEHAETAYEFFLGRGYRVRIEDHEIYYPSRPTLVCVRDRTTLFIEVHVRVPLDLIKNWVAFCSSRPSDTQIAMCLPEIGVDRIPTPEITRLQDMRVGLYVVTTDRVIERLVPADLSVNIALPPIETLPLRVQRLIGGVYQSVDRNQWREAFNDACQIAEDQARRHMKKGLHSNRIVILQTNGSVQNLTDAQVDRLTMGQLKDTFARIQNPNQTDTIIYRALSQVNPDRVEYTHRRTRAKTEQRLRANTGKHMYAIINVLKTICS